MLAYLSRYTHRVAIANSRLLAMDERSVTFKWKDYRDKSNPDKARHKTMRGGTAVDKAFSVFYHLYTCQRGDN